VLNVSKFVLGIAPAHPGAGATTAPVDRAMLGRLGGLTEEATAALDGYDYARALERTEAFFWSFCDDYVELVKGRAYGAAGEGGAASAASSLRLALSALLRLFAPFMPFVTEEVWSWWHQESIHRAPWPSTAELGEAGGDENLIDLAAWVLGKVRAAKSEHKLSMRAPVAKIVIRDSQDRLALIRLVADDLRQAGSIAEIVMDPTAEDVEATVEVELAV
jgi:valyl-tRNA synthetase